MGAGIQPGKAAAHLFDRQTAVVQIAFQKRGDFQLAPIRRPDGPCPPGGGAVQEIKARDGKVRRRRLRLFDDRANLSVRLEIDHAIAFGIGYPIAEDRPALAPPIGVLQQLRQAMPEKDVVPQHHGRGRAGQEILGQEIGLGQPVGRGLGDPFEAQPPLPAIAQKALELRLVVGRGDDRDLADAGQHQHRNRIIDHRLVIKRQKLLGHAQGDRIKARAGTPGQNDALACGHVAYPRWFRTLSRSPRQSGRPMPKSRAMRPQSSRELAGRRAGVG